MCWHHGQGCPLTRNSQNQTRVPRYPSGCPTRPLHLHRVQTPMTGSYLATACRAARLRSTRAPSGEAPYGSPAPGSVLTPLLKLVLSELPMTKVRRRDPRSTLFGFCTSAGPAMQPATSILPVGRTLTRVAPTCLRTAPLPWPVRPEPPLDTDGHIVFCQHEYHPAYEVLLYRKLSGASRWVEPGIRYLHLGHDVEPTFIENSCPLIFICK